MGLGAIRGTTRSLAVVRGAATSLAASSLAVASVATVPLVVHAMPAAGGEVPVPAPAPSPRLAALRFDAELVRLTVLGDSLEIDGHYQLLARAGFSGVARLLYPFPEDSLLGPAHMTRLEMRCGASAVWRPLAWVTLPRRPAVLWRIPMCDAGSVEPGGADPLLVRAADSLEVHAVYRQPVRGRMARYIVTTTRGWGRPLRRARFEIRLPVGLEPERFSYPFERRLLAGRPVYVYETTEFMPDRDIIVWWRERSRE